MKGRSGKTGHASPPLDSVTAHAFGRFGVPLTEQMSKQDVREHSEVFRSYASGLAKYLTDIAVNSQQDLGEPVTLPVEQVTVLAHIVLALAGPPLRGRPRLASTNQALE